MREIYYVGDTLKSLKALPKDVLQKFAQELHELMDKDTERAVESKSLNGLGSGVRELKKNGRPAYRLVYVIRGNVIHVLHVFTKTSTGTDKKHEETIKKRYKNL
ncbi:type II toxin-antitoxin system RelE/ParE family toxin [Vibrio harveyi]|uniref:type II toxin-antitoxin system RelE/ParE family toxin n=1 Tax=Vibrio harveyi TaxID=669 RepID=UPI0006829D00|nr:type II toxin-antitoxin system RelE/ParE family toxin [Vibrio harveyi]ELI6428068.1 type II toxin-antitoxin system RelE/ParE family toxin [Vibrio harveyi]